MAEPVRAIVLDFNGTLAQDDHLVAPLFAAGFASLGLELSAEEYHREFAATPDREVFEEALRRAGRSVDPDHRDALVQARLDGYLAAVAERPPIEEHARAFVREAASRGVVLAITTGAFRQEIEAVLEAAGVREYFTAVVTIDDVVNGKPHPEGFTLALERLGASGCEIPAGAAVAVEDATDGALAARSAGMRVAAIRGRGYDESSGYADVIIERLDLDGLARILALGADGR